MEIGFSPGMHWGHSSTYEAHVRTYQDSAGGGGGGGVYVCEKEKERNKIRSESIILDHIWVRCIIVCKFVTG